MSTLNSHLRIIVTQGMFVNLHSTDFVINAGDRLHPFTPLKIGKLLHLETVGLDEGSRMMVKQLSRPICTLHVKTVGCHERTLTNII